MAEAPHRLGRFEILEPLARGGAGTTYKAQDTATQEVVDLKLLPKEILQDADAVERFRREASAVARLQHANIVRILDQGEADGQIYLATEHVEGTTLDVVLKQRRLSLQEVVQVVKQVGRALEAAHRAGVVHRDLNPRNIIVTPTLSVVKLSEFGISRVESVARKLGTLTTKEMTLGTLSYLAPEQAADAAAVDHRADIYSLGVIFYEALTGRIPLGRFSLPAELNRELPSDIDPIVLKCLATDPARRFGSVGQLLEEVEKLEAMMRFQLLDELQGLKRGTSKILGSGSPLGKGGTLALFGLLAAGLVGAGVWMLLHPVETKSEPPAKAEATEAKNEAPATPASPSPNGESPAEAAPKSTPTSADRPAPESTPQAKPATPQEAKREPAPSTESKPKPTKPAVDPAIAELQVAQGKFDAKLYDQALADAQKLIANYPSSPSALEAYYLVAKAQLGLGRSQDALGTFVEIQSRFRGDSRAAEAAFQQAKLVQAADTKKSTEEARRLYSDCASQYPTSSWAARALAARAEIEREQRATVRDAELGTNVPAALATYRDLTARFAGEPVAEKAWWELGQMYEDLKRWDLAVAAYEGLGAHFPKSRFDAWFQAGEIYERRLKDAGKAKGAYAKVPTTSPHFKEAQRKAGN